MKVTKADVERIKKNLEEAKRCGDAKKISFYQATLNIYRKKLKGWTF